MLRIAAALLVALAAPSAEARAPEWRWAAEQEVLLTPYDYDPPVLRLPAREPVRLRFYNGGRTVLVFEAKEFFRSAQVRPADAAAVASGQIRVPPGEAVSVSLVAAPGRYKVRSSNLLHRLLGMRGEIVVE